MNTTINVYDDYADQYAKYIESTIAADVNDDPFGILSRMLGLLEDVSGRTVLDAGCGEGYLSRVLAGHGAKVTGIDISPALLHIARGHDVECAIQYHVGDLCGPLPEWKEQFDAIGSRFVLNDVYDHEGFASTLFSVLKPDGRAVLAFNSPYGAVIRGHVTDYFDSGKISPYRGLWAAGVEVFHHHRTLEEYLDAFLSVGFRLWKLVDVPTYPKSSGTLLPGTTHFPLKMILAFEKPAERLESVNKRGGEPSSVT